MTTSENALPKLPKMIIDGRLRPVGSQSERRCRGSASVFQKEKGLQLFPQKFSFQKFSPHQCIIVHSASFLFHNADILLKEILIHLYIF